MLRLRRLPLLAAGLLAALAVAPASGTAAEIDPTVGDVAGSGQRGFAGDGDPAGQALFNFPRDSVAHPDGGVLIADRDNNAIRRVLPNGIMSTDAGGPFNNCGPSTCGDGGPATSAELNAPTGVAVFPDGDYLIADANNHRVRRVDDQTNVITTVAGTTQGFSGDNGPATAAQLNTPREVAVMPDGGFLVVDSENHRIRRVLPNGTIVTVAGTGAPGFSGDGGPATGAQLNQPFDVGVQLDGGFLIADRLNNRIRRVRPDGRIETAAGSGATPGFEGDGLPALEATLNQPQGVEVLASGGFLIADTENSRIRRVSPGGTISTEAGTSPGSSTGPGSQAQLRRPTNVGLRPGGQVLLADTDNQRVRSLSQSGEPPPAALRQSIVLDPLETGIRVRERGTARFRTLRSDENVPLGSNIDTAAGEVQVTVQPTATGEIDRMNLSQGLFSTRQTTGDRPFTEFAISKPPKRCAAKQSGTKGAPRVFKRLRFRGRGRSRARVRGRGGVGARRGTDFITEDRCNGTLFVVREGRIVVTDFVTGRRIHVRAGERYFARLNGPRRFIPRD